MVYVFIWDHLYLFGTMPLLCHFFHCPGLWFRHEQKSLYVLELDSNYIAAVSGNQRMQENQSPVKNYLNRIFAYVKA